MASALAASTFLGASVAVSTVVRAPVPVKAVKTEARASKGSKGSKSSKASAGLNLVGGGPTRDAFFDPLNLSAGKDDNEILLWREAELTHGRVSMLATAGFVAEKFNPLFDGKIKGPAINHFQQVPQPFWSIVVIGIAMAEAYRLQEGWLNPRDGGYYKLRPGYQPGDLGYDPLGLKPSDPEALAEMQTKELNNGRLAMIGIAGMVVQEFISQQPIF